MTNTFGEAELDAYMKIIRHNGVVEHFHVVDGNNEPMTAAEYAAATKEG